MDSVIIYDVRVNCVLHDALPASAVSVCVYVCVWKGDSAVAELELNSKPLVATWDMRVGPQICFGFGSGSPPKSQNVLEQIPAANVETGQSGFVYLCVRLHVSEQEQGMFPLHSTTSTPKVSGLIFPSWESDAVITHF